jgi:GT2 family glycosyltransferase
MVSIIIPNLHSPVIDQVLAALQQQTCRQQIKEIIVVGQDRHGLIPPDVTYIETPRPISAAAARNLGVQHAMGEYVVFLDADCLAAPDLIERLLARHQQGYAVVGGSIALEAGDYWTLCDNALVFTLFLSTTPAGERPYLPSLNLSIRRDLFLASGGFDESFPGAAGEDTDLSFRLRQQGIPLFFEPRAQVTHRPQRTSALAIWNHSRRFGQLQVTFWSKYTDLADVRRNPRLWQPFAGMVLAAAPLIALRDVLLLYWKTPSLRSFWYLLMGMVWGKTAWYWGAAEMLMISRNTA